MNGSHLDTELRAIKDQLLVLGGMVERAVLNSVAALKDRDFEKSKIVLENDETVNFRCFEVERLAIRIIANQRPVARDLRRVTAILDLSRELERIGDYAKGIATINLRSGGLDLTRLLSDLDHMSHKSADMLHRSITAFMLEDPELAENIIREDTLIDALYNQLYFEVLDSAVDDPGNIECVNYVLWVGHNLERMADRATNICERVIFIATGKLGGQGMYHYTAFAHQFQNA